MATADCSTAAFLPFLKKKPIVAAPKKEEEHDPLALPLPPLPKYLSSSSTSSGKSAQFVAKLNSGKAKPSAGKAAAAAGGNGSARRPLAGAGLPAAKAAKTGPSQSPAAAAKADADAKRLRQLERMAKLGALTSGADAPPELRERVEQAKRTAQAIKQQREEAERRRAEAERLREQRQADLQRMQLEKQRQLEARLKAIRGPGASVAGAAARGVNGAAAAAAAAAAASSRQQNGAVVGGRAAGGAAAARQHPSSGQQQQSTQQQQHRQAHQQQQQQSNKDPYAHLPPKQRAFMLARQREREGQARGSRGSPGVRCRGGGAGYDGGYESDDSMDSFIDDGEEEDWRSELRQLTRYDPSKYRDSAADDRMMEASAADIAREEARSKRIAKTEDEREAEAEARRAAAKEAKKRKRKGAGSFFDD